MRNINHRARLSTAILVCLGINASAQDTWSPIASFMGTARQGAVSFTVDGINGAFVGTGNDGTFRNDFWRYDQATDSWSQIADLPGVGRMYAAAFSTGFSAFVGTGKTGNGSSAATYASDFYMLDPFSNTWFSIPDYPIPCAYAIGLGTRANVDNRGFVGLGIDAGLNTQNAFYQLTGSSIVDFAWTPRAPFDGTGRAYATAFNVGNAGYVGFGVDNTNTVHNDLWHYDVYTDTWTQKTSCPGSIRFAASAFAIGPVGYITGGTDNATALNDLWAYNALTDTWSSRSAPGPSGRFGAVAFKILGTGYLATGTSAFGAGNNLTDARAYTPEDYLDCDGATNGPAVPGAQCVDNDPCTFGEIMNVACQCVGTLSGDQDQDGLCDATDPCPSVFNGPGSTFSTAAIVTPSISVLIGSDCVGEQYYPGSTPGSASATYGSDHFYRFTTSTCMTALSITICEPTNPPVTLALHLLSEDGTELEYTVKQPFQTCLEMDPFLVEPGTTYHLVIESPDDLSNYLLTILQTNAGPDTDGDGICDDTDSCPTLPGIVGSPCDDGDPFTSSDTLNTFCQCVGIPADCVPGTACDDNNPGTLFDVYDADCACVGELLTCTGGTMSNCDDVLELTASPAGGSWSGFGVTGSQFINGSPGTHVGANPVQYTITDPSGIYTCETNVVVTETPYWGADPDGDGFAQLTAQNIIQTCIPPPGYVNQFGDDCPFDPLKLSPGTCGCGNVDHPNFEPCGDGNVCNGAEIWFDCECIAGTPLNCDDGNPCTVDSCDPLTGCVNTPAPDADGDGVCDAQDNCPSIPGQVGSSCNDNNPCTTNDVLNANCQCVGTPVPDGTLCALNAHCIAGACTPIGTDTDGDGIPDATDSCPTVPGQIGSVCTDNNPLTLGDALNTACVCQGYPGTQVSMYLYTDGNGAQISWKLFNSYTGALVYTGSGYGNNTNYGITITVPQTCLELRVYDSGGNGFNPGGYRLEDASGRRLVDNMDNGFTITDSTSTVFCLPISDNKLINAHVDREDWLTTNTIIASADAAVSAQWGIGDQTDDGYQFWFTDPNGGYSRKITRTHATSSGQGPANAVRACKLPLSSIVTNPLPFDRLLNVRIRSRVNGLFGEFGQASRFRILAAPSTCPLTKLNDVVGDAHLSCGATKYVGASGDDGKVFAKVVTSNGQPATHYRFEFAFPSEGYLRNHVSTSATLLLGNWITNPLLCGTNGYTVRVQASFDGGLSYCPWGVSCPLVITNNTPSCTPLGMTNTCGNGVVDPGEACDDGNLVNGDGCDADCSLTGAVAHQRSATSSALAYTHTVTLFPNPTTNGHFTLRIDGEEMLGEVLVDVLDATGRVVLQRRAAVDGTAILMDLRLLGTVGDGTYVVRITTGRYVHTERLVLAR